MSKKTFQRKRFLLSFFIIVVSICILGTAIYKISKRNEVIKNAKNLPSFSFLNQKGLSVFSDSIIHSNKVIINFFSPSCEHCQYIAKTLFQKRDTIKDMQIFMISQESALDIRRFSTEYHLDSIPSIVLLRDAKYEFENIFGTSIIPSFFVYRNKKLTKKVLGETDLSHLIGE
ncbi:MAG: redoxin domain-containing protein [Sphingobacteriia bacterium]|nr:redoxin domain-containing protein [Sphingobacteriia bacterium]